MARAYDADNPATAIETMLLKAVDEASIISERREDITAVATIVATIVATGIEVRGLTCKARTVSSRILHTGLKEYRMLHQLTFASVL